LCGDPRSKAGKEGAVDDKLLQARKLTMAFGQQLCSNLLMYAAPFDPANGAPSNSAVRSDSEPPVRFVDLCAGIGGFHLATSIVSARLQALLGSPIRFQCVAAAETDPELRRTYVQNFPEVGESYKEFYPAEQVAKLHQALPDEKSRSSLPVYNAAGELAQIHGDVATFLSADRQDLSTWQDGMTILPQHDILFAGFPCQPFSKSGSQRGFADIRGTVFHLIAKILELRRPSIVLLENVGNFERHDDGNTWRRTREVLEAIGYTVEATEHKGSGAPGVGLLSPHQLGYPQHRGRFFILAQLRDAEVRSRYLPPSLRAALAAGLSDRHSPLAEISRALEINPVTDKELTKSLRQIISVRQADQQKAEYVGSAISSERLRCIRHWDKLLTKLAEDDKEKNTAFWRTTMPSFPIWGYELDPWQWYPADSNPRESFQDLDSLIQEREHILDTARETVFQMSNRSVDLHKLAPRGRRAWLGDFLNHESAGKWIADWPGYAQKRNHWPDWKMRFIRQNREWAFRLWSTLDATWLRDWLDQLFTEIPAPSHQKLEWNCKGDDLSLKQHILQFRPSGLRVKRLVHIPALVAMTATQVPIVPTCDIRPSFNAEWRHLVPSEALQLQGFPSRWCLPEGREVAFSCLGNAVHAGLVADICLAWWFNVPPRAISTQSRPTNVKLKHRAAKTTMVGVADATGIDATGD
jgi:DNA (cytosine-5)-methyltransferase 1